MAFSLFQIFLVVFITPSLSLYVFITLPPHSQQTNLCFHFMAAMPHYPPLYSSFLHCAPEIEYHQKFPYRKRNNPTE